MKRYVHEADPHWFGVAQSVPVRIGRAVRAGRDSDVDLFFDADNPRFSLIEQVDVQDRVTNILGAECDVMTRASLHPMLRPRIEAEAQRVF